MTILVCSYMPMQWFKFYIDLWLHLPWYSHNNKTKKNGTQLFANEKKLPTSSKERSARRPLFWNDHMVVWSVNLRAYLHHFQISMYVNSGHDFTRFSVLDWREKTHSTRWTTIKVFTHSIKTNKKWERKTCSVHTMHKFGMVSWSQESQLRVLCETQTIDDNDSFSMALYQMQSYIKIWKEDENDFNNIKIMLTLKPWIQSKWMSIEWKSFNLLTLTSKSFAYCYKMAMKQKRTTEQKKNRKHKIALLWLVRAPVA